MRETFGKRECERAEQLIGYLYGESDAGERSDFECHLRNCAACRDEAAAFTHVRGSVAEFRTELLSAAPTVSLERLVTEAAAQHAGVQSSLAPALAGSTRPAQHDSAPPVAVPHATARGALAALVEFFRLSPVWLRASTGAVALALCARILLGILNAEVSFADGHFALRAGSRPAAQAAEAPVSPPAQQVDTAALRAQLNSLAAERDAAVRELQAAREQMDDGRAADIVAAKSDGTRRVRRNFPPTHDEGRRRGATSEAPRPAPRSRATRRVAEDEDLPRLLDLIGGVN
jgi:hypothetical protein